MSLLSIDNLHVKFEQHDATVHAVNGISLSIDKGQALAVVGESGSGKSVTFFAALGLLPDRGVRVDGSVKFAGQELLGLDRKRLSRIRGDRIAMIFQDPMTSLNPYLRVGRQLAEVLEVHRGLKRKPALHRAIAMLERCGIDQAARRAEQYPHQFSGGMRQRAMIAMALLCEPDLLIADEPTTALDVTVQAQVIALLLDIQRSSDMSVVLITHDLGVVAGVADDVLVMYAGRVMERAAAESLFSAPAHPYTRALLDAVPRIDATEQKLVPIPGLPPDAKQMNHGCPFAARCSLEEARCHSHPMHVSSGPQNNCWKTAEAGS